FLATPHRPSGPTGPQAAVSSLVDELDWLLSVLAPPAQRPGLEVCVQENAEAGAAAIAALRAAASRLDGEDERPDLERLDETRQALAREVARRIPELPAMPDDRALSAALEPAFRIRVLSYAARQVAVYALLASGETAPETDGEPSARRPVAMPVRAALQATEQLTVEHASARSIW